MSKPYKLSPTENKGFYQKIIALVIPMAIQNLINVGVTAADIVMLGYIDETAISAVSLANQIHFILILIIFGITSGAGILTAQYWGKQNIRAIENILAISLDFAIAVAALFSLATAFFPSMLMSAYSSDPAVISLGAQYLRIVGITYTLGAITTVYFNAMRSIEKVVLSATVYAISLAINIIVNGLLMFGLFGLPKLGVVGAAIGTVAARSFEFLVVMYCSFKKNSMLRIVPQFLFKLDMNLFFDFLKYSSPVIINELLWGLGTSVNAGIVGRLSTQAAAANAIAMVIKQLAQVISMGVAAATAVILGKMIGEGEMIKAKLYSLKLIKISIILGGISSIGMFLLRDIPSKYMALTDMTNDYLIHMIFVLLFILVAQAFNATMIVGVFRAGGDSKFGLLADVSAMWGFSVPFSMLAGFVFKWDVRIVYIFLLSDELIKIPICAWRYGKGLWLKNVTRDNV